MRNLGKMLSCLMLMGILVLGSSMVSNAKDFKCAKYTVKATKYSYTDRVSAGTSFTSNEASTASVSVYITAYFKNTSTGAKKKVEGGNGYVFSTSRTVYRPAANYVLSSSTSKHTASFNGITATITLN